MLNILQNTIYFSISDAKHPNSTAWMPEITIGKDFLFTNTNYKFNVSFNENINQCLSSLVK